LDAEGEIERLLRGDHTEQRRALEMTLGAIKARPDRIAELIAPYAGSGPDYNHWLQWVTRFADLHTSRMLLDLVIEALPRGEYSDQNHMLWLSAYHLADHQPAWAVDLVAAYLINQPNALTLDALGRVSLLEQMDHAAIDLITKAAASAPREFCDALLPYMQTVMRLTEHDPDDWPVRDGQFSHYFDEGTPREFDNALEQAARTALRKLAADDAESLRPTLELLVADDHETAQLLLLEALQAAGDVYADWATTILLGEDQRMLACHSSSLVESIRRLLKTISPYIPADLFGTLEQAILQMRPPWESRPMGLRTFSLLTALPDTRLSGPGRRRLGELRRLFRVDEPPDWSPLHGGAIGSPIPERAFPRMTDGHWLRAIAKYNTDDHNWTTMKGGAVQLAQALQVQAAADPDRYARLALRIPPDAHGAYMEYILIGLGNSTTAGTPEAIFDVIRRVASLGQSDRWLSWPLRRYLDGP